MRRCQYTIPMTGLALVILLLVTACTPASPFRAPEVDEAQVKIMAPANYSTASQGGTIVIRALVDDPRGIAMVQLWVDGQSVATEFPSTPSVTQLTQELYWTPNVIGRHEIKVVAQNNASEWAQSEPVTLYVVDALAQATTIAAQLATATPNPFAVATPLPTSPYTPPPPFTPTPTHTPTPATPTPCYDNAAYVADITVPDGSQFVKGAAFDKTWRLRNTGTCTWDTRYQFIFVEGVQLGGPSPTALPYAVPPGSIMDITVPMLAPTAMGTYTSRWQIHNPERVKFGTVVYALIEVRPGPDDPPVITRFDVVPNVIRQGQSATIYWEYVNGNFGRLTPGGEGGVGPVGQLVVSPNATTSYRLVVDNGAGSVERTFTLIVQPGPAPPPAPPSPGNLVITAVRPDGFDLTWTDTSTDEQGFRLYNADTGQVVATFASNSVGSAVGGLACGTSYRLYLVAFNERGESWPSNMVQAATSACGG